MNQLFISTETFKLRSGATSFVQDDQIRPLIKVAQDVFVMEALGSTLYKRLLTGIKDDSLNSNEKYLIDNYVCDCMVWATMSYLAIPMGFQLFSKGFLQKHADNSVVPIKKDLDYVETYYKQIAENYKQRMIDYLKANYTKFQEYADPGCGWDVVNPVSGGYECPIYIGDEKNCVTKTESVKEYSHPVKSTYKATGGETSFVPYPSIEGKTILMASRANRLAEVVTEETTDTNELQADGQTIYLPSGDQAMPNEVFNFLII